MTNNNINIEESSEKDNAFYIKSTISNMYSSSDSNVNSNSLDHKPESTLIKEKNKSEKRRIIWNVIVISVAFMIHFTAYMGTSNLQSSVNAAQGLGTMSLMTTYVFMSLSAIFLPVLLIKWLGCKWTLVLTLIAYIPYIAAQVYARFYTLIPAALVVGLGAGPLWCAQSVYINLLAEVYAEIDGVPTSTVLAQFFGIFFMLFQTSEIWGNLISSTVFSTGDFKDDTVNTNTTKDIWKTCGSNFCPGTDVHNSNPNFERPSDEKIYTIAGIYLACMIFACLSIVFGVVTVKRYDMKEKSNSSKGVSGIRLLIVTLKLLGNCKVLFLLPLTIWMGVQQVFRSADFTADYVSCSWGISNIGYVLICYGITTSLASLVTGYLVKLTGRLLMILFAVILQFAIFITMYFWTPTEGSIIFFIISGVWGITDAILLVQISALYGLLFPGNEAAAYSNFRTWKSVGFILAYAYSPYLCTNNKLFIVFGLLVIGTFGYCTVERLLRSTK